MQPSPRRWLMISFAFWATVINYLDRQTLSVAAPVLREQFHMSNVEYSRVVFAFLLAYTLGNGISGPVIDRLGTKLGYALCMVWWSVAALLHGFATGGLSLGMFRFLLGIGEAGNWPAGVKVVTEWFPERERALASGIFNSGSAVGAILAPPIVAWILLRYGWPIGVCLQSAAVGLIWLFLWLPTYRTAARGCSRIRSAADSRPRTRAHALCSRIYILKGLPGPGVVLLHLLVSRISDTGARIRHGGHRQVFVDSVRSGRCRQFPGRRPFRLAAAARQVTVTVARKGAVTFFAALMTSAIGAVLVQQGVACDRARFHRDARLYRQPREYAGYAGRRISQERCRFRLWARKYGLRIRRHAVHADHRLGGGPLLVHASVHRLRGAAADLCDDSVAPSG